MALILALVELVGLGLIVAGAALLAPWLGLVVAGLLLVGVAALLSTPEPSQRDSRSSHTSAD